MEEFKNFNIHDLFLVIKKDDDDFLQWLVDKKLIWKTKYCVCGKEMVKVYNKGNKWPIWRCSNRKEHDGKLTTKGFFDGTFFSGSHLTPKQVIEFTYYWCRDTHTQEEFKFDMGISSNSVVDWKSFRRDIAASYFLNHPEKIGGVNKTVEIDETVLCRPKYYKGREMVKEQQWFFGGIERGTGKAFMEPVMARNAQTLLHILQKYVEAGSIIVSDCWKSYGSIAQLPEGYKHYVVNHSVEFVNKETKQHTNTIESQWQKFKQKHKERYGTNRGLLNSYMEEFLWRKKFGGPDVFFYFWSQIAENYPIDN